LPGRFLLLALELRCEVFVCEVRGDDLEQVPAEASQHLGVEGLGLLQQVGLTWLAMLSRHRVHGVDDRTSLVEVDPAGRQGERVAS